MVCTGSPTPRILDKPFQLYASDHTLPIPIQILGQIAAATNVLLCIWAALEALLSTVNFSFSAFHLCNCTVLIQRPLHYHILAIYQQSKFPSCFCHCLSVSACSSLSCCSPHSLVSWAQALSFSLPPIPVLSQGILLQNPCALSCWAHFKAHSGNLVCPPFFDPAVHLTKNLKESTWWALYPNESPSGSPLLSHPTTSPPTASTHQESNP